MGQAFGAETAGSRGRAGKRREPGYGSGKQHRRRNLRKMRWTAKRTFRGYG